MEDFSKKPKNNDGSGDKGKENLNGEYEELPNLESANQKSS